MNPTPLIIGIGSPFGADRLGWLAVEHLQARRPELRTRLLDRPGAGLLHHLQGERAVCLIDAARGHAPVGHLYRLTPGELPQEGLALTSSHALGVAEALALGAAVGELPEPLWLLAVETGEHGDPEAVLETAWPALCAAVDRFLDRAADTQHSKRPRRSQHRGLKDETKGD